jgi:hypothetical protein
MSFRIPRLRKKTKFYFPRKMASSTPTSSSQPDSSTISLPIREKEVIPASSRISGADEDPTDFTMTAPPVPSIYRDLPIIKDDQPATISSDAQADTVEECAPFLSLENFSPSELTENGLPKLEWARHIRFLKHSLTMLYPAGWVGLDPSRPWSVYWAINGLYMLGEDVSQYTDR